MFAASQQVTLSEYISQFIQRAKDPQSGLKQIEIPASLKSHSNQLGFKFKTSFGQGSRTHIPWLACLANGQGASVEGVYPVLLFHTKTNQLFVTYGESETAIKKAGSWPTEWPNEVIAKLPNFPHSQFGAGKVLGNFDCTLHIDANEIANQFINIINVFLKMIVERSPNSEQLKTVKMDELAQNLHESTSQIGLTLPVTQIKRFLAAQATKPFVILTGLSGSGKTKLAEALAYWLSEKAEKQICMVAVGADWTNNEPLLGYADAINKGHYCAPASGILRLLDHAHKTPKAPHFLILDEMNLSHVERYFADFLSAMESSEPALALHGQKTLKADNLDVPARVDLPRNVFIVGTVNVDETTYMFSPKVLDRANVIEFRVSAEQMSDFLAAPVSSVNVKDLTGEGAHYAEAFLARAQLETSLDQDVATQLQQDLIELFVPLAEVGAEFGYRSAKEIARFVAIHRELSGENWDYKDALDAQVMQKLMPKLHGSARKLTGVLNTLEKFALERDLPLTKNKVARMQKRLKDEGFTSFAEN
jgi:5-methylcytosine-specific restriction protein B